MDISHILDEIVTNQLVFSEDEIHPIVHSELEYKENISCTITPVRKVHHKKSDRWLVGKFLNIPNPNSTDPQVRSAFERAVQEVKLHKSLIHSEHIVHFYGSIFEDSLKKERLIVFMELLDTSLADFYPKVHQIRKGFPEELLGSIGVSILNALSECKEKQIIHRDVKPKNILLNRAGQVKLCDFGVSRILKDSLATTTVGTFNYMPPEYFSGDVSAFDVSADVWSLGLTLLETATGEHPFSDIRLIPALILKKCNELTPERIDTMLENYSVDTKDFVKTCLKPYGARPKHEPLKKSNFYKFFEKTYRAPKISDQINQLIRYFLLYY